MQAQPDDSTVIPLCLLLLLTLRILTSVLPDQACSTASRCSSGRSGKAEGRPQPPLQVGRVAAGQGRDGEQVNDQPKPISTMWRQIYKCNRVGEAGRPHLKLVRPSRSREPRREPSRRSRRYSSRRDSGVSRSSINSMTCGCYDGLCVVAGLRQAGREVQLGSGRIGANGGGIGGGVGGGVGGCPTRLPKRGAASQRAWPGLAT